MPSKMLSTTTIESQLRSLNGKMIVEILPLHLYMSRYSLFQTKCDETGHAVIYYGKVPH